MRSEPRSAVCAGVEPGLLGGRAGAARGRVLLSLLAW